MNKKFIFRYEPQSSVKEMFSHLEEAVKTGKKYIQPKNISIINDLTVVSRILSKTRLEIFSAIKKKQPSNIHDLTQLVQRDYANVWRDCQVLANCGIIELKKVKQENKPIALYGQIVISCEEEPKAELDDLLICFAEKLKIQPTDLGNAYISRRTSHINN
jgi:predicted transcriptional regulator